MEVHHHSHAHGKKKFREYLLEFLMLFLAVTLGFLAENLREHLTEQRKEKEYIVSFIDDLQNDTSEITNTSKLLFRIVHQQDTLIDLLQHYNNNDSINKRCYRYYLRSAVSVAFVTFNQNTLNQLLNTGSIRLITKQKVLDSIMAYTSLTKSVNVQGEYYNDGFKKAFDYSSNLFNFSFLHMHLNENYKMQPAMRFDTAHFKLVDTRPEVIRKYTDYLIMQQNLCSNYIIQLRYARENAARLIPLLKKEYHVKKDE